MVQMGVLLEKDGIRTTPGGLLIQFQRTIKVPDNGQISNLPPDFGEFELYDVGDYEDRLPPAMVKKGGAFFAMYQSEAMWLSFTSKMPFAITIYSGGVNAVSGESTKNSMVEMPQEKITPLKQGYVVTPSQLWLDGFAVSPGRVRQFVAAPLGAGYTVEAQVTGEEVQGGLQFEVTPQIVRMPIGVKGQKRNLKVTTGCTEYSLRLSFMNKAEIVYVFLEVYEGIPRSSMRLVYDGGYAKSVLEVHQRQVGGGSCFDGHGSEMGLAAGGLIEQSIEPDTGKVEWDIDQTMVFNVQIVNSAQFYVTTGRLPPRPPISAKEYEELGLPFYSLEEEISQIHGTFGGVKSVGEIDGVVDETVNPRVVHIERSHELKLNPDGPLKPFQLVRGKAV